jgi:hypothetical protein
MAVKHRVNRLALEVQSSNCEEALRLRVRLRQSWHAILPALEAEFDVIAGDERWVRLGRLRLDLRVADAKALEGELAGRVREAIGRALGHERTPEEFLDSPRDGSLGRRDETLRSVPPAPRDGADPLEALEHYLLTGRLPWYLPRGTGGTGSVRSMACNGWRQLAAVCARQREVGPWLRWLDLVEGADCSLSELLDIAVNGEQRNLQRGGLAALLRILSDPQGPIAARHRRHGLLAAALAKLGSESRAHESAPVSLLSAEAGLSVSEWRRVASAFGQSEPVRTWMDEFCEPLRRERPAGVPCATGPDEDVPLAPPPGNAAQPAINLRMADLPETQAVQVAYAGSVLLHPWLTRLFDACGLPVGDGTIPAPAHERATALLCFAVTGADHDAEFNLEFFKVLLGLPRDLPLSVAGDLLGNDERAEVEAMLASFVGHWSALKGTTIAGLRSAFLQRPGTLKPVEDGYALAIERTGIDVLLDRIPFSYSLVKLPWMPRPIHVEW